MLSTRQRHLYAITELWGGLRLRTFRDRLLLQKRMFFVALSGIELGYSHSWYLRGPYSPALTRDAFNIDETLHASSVPVPELSPKLVDKLRELAESFGNEWNDDRHMELYASLCYLSGIYKTTELGFLSEKLHELKSEISREDAARAVEVLRNRGFLDG